jgi:hypothetical protein
MLNLTDKEIARVFLLAEEIVAIRRTIPDPPKTYVKQLDVQEEIARALRDTLEEQRGTLVELSLLLEAGLILPR